MGKDKKNNNEEIYYEYEKPKGKGLPIVIISLITVAILVFFFFYKDDIIENFTSQSEGGNIELKESETIIEKDFAKGIRLSSIGRYDEALSYFEKLDFEKLNESDQYVVLTTYLNANKDQEALDLDVTFDEEVIDKHLSNDEMEKLRDLETSSELVTFEIALLDQDYEKIIALKDIDRLEIDERRANAIANAYYMLGEKEEAVNFTSLMVFDGINMWALETKVDVAGAFEEVPGNTSSAKESPSSVLVLVIISIVLIVVVIVSMYFLRGRLPFLKKKKSEKVIEKKEEDIPDPKDDKYSYHYDDASL